MSVKKLVLPNYADKKLQICKMIKLQVCVITNICNPIFVTYGRIGTRLGYFSPNQAPILPRVTNIGLKFFVTFVTFYQYL
jgi:hypothetical protein